MFKAKTNYIFLILSLLLVPQLAHSMQQPSRSTQLVSSMQSSVAAVRQRLIDRFGPTGAEAVLKMVGWYLKIKEKLKPKPKPIEPFDPLKSLVLGTGRLLTDHVGPTLYRNKTTVMASSAGLLTLVWVYLVGKTWYYRSQERTRLYDHLLETTRADGRALICTVKQEYENFPDHAKNKELKQKIDDYETALKAFLETRNDENRKKLNNAYSQLSTCIVLLKH